MAVASRKSAVKNQSWAPIWCAASAASPVRAATDAATVNAMKNATVRSPRSRADASWRRIRAQEGASGAPRRASSTRNTLPDAVWATTLAMADPRIPRSSPNTSTAERHTEATFAMPIT